MRLREILCPTDFSDASREALHFAIDLARQYRARLHLLNVYQMPGYALPEGVVISGPEVLNELIDSVEAEIAQWKEEAERVGLSGVVTDSALGTPHTEIEKYAREHDIDLIVIGTHGRTGLKHVLLGSVAEKVVRHAPCPVLTVRARDHALHDVAPEPSGASTP